MANQPPPALLTLAEKQRIAEKRCWEPWTASGPKLRVDSYTARLLTFLTPRSAHLESRGEFIGDFLPNWVEENIVEWERAIAKCTQATKDANLNFQNLSKRNINHQRRILDLELANQIANDTAQSIQSDSAKRDRLMREMRRRRRRFREDQLREIELRKKPEKIPDLKGSESVKSRESLKSRESVKSRESNQTEFFDASQSLLSSTKLPSSSSEVVTTNSDLGGQVAPVISEDLSENQSYSIATKPSPKRGFFRRKCRLKSLRRSLISSLKRKRRLFAKSPADLRSQSVSTSSVTLPSQSPTNASLAKKVRVLSPHELPKASIDPVLDPIREPITSIAQSLMSHSSTLANKSSNYWHHLPFTKVTKYGPKIYQGKFLVQERRTKRLEPNLNRTDDQTATTLVSRWKECAVLARRNRKVDQPLNLYFYRSSNMEKLKKKQDKTHGLEHKVKLSRGYRIALFSPLDFSLAIWKPRKKRRRKFRHRIRPRVHRNVKDYFRARQPPKTPPKHERHTKILVVHAQSLTAILDLAYLLAAATGAAPMLYGRSTFSVGVPSINAQVQIEARRDIHNDPQKLERALECGLDKLVPYRELLSPVVYVSSAAKPVLRQTWQLIEQLPHRFGAGRCKGNDKFALAYVLQNVDSHPLWIPSALTTMFPLNRLRFLVNDCAQLVLAQPDPKCYLDTLVEPPFVEGYCQQIDAVFSRSTSKKLNSQSIAYLFTSDHYLLVTLAEHATPPMLASAQNSLVKKIDPFPLTSDETSVRWLQESTCLAEVDRKTAIAKCELERRKCLLTHCQTAISLLRFNSFEVQDEVWVEIGSTEHSSRFKIEFSSAQLAAVWQNRLAALAQYWQRKVAATAQQRLTPFDAGNYEITPFLQNRAIVFSGQLFLKTHRFATFKSYHVILTSSQLIVFRIGTTLRAPARPQQTVPAQAVNHEHTRTIDLFNSYVYSGIAASHALLNNDVYNDPSNPGVLALPRSYDYGRITTDTEQDRCFVVWFPQNKWLAKLGQSTGRFYAFLAPEKAVRDDWVTAIKCVQDTLQLRSDEEDLDAKLFLNADNEN